MDRHEFMDLYKEIPDDDPDLIREDFEVNEKERWLGITEGASMFMAHVRADGPHKTMLAIIWWNDPKSTKIVFELFKKYYMTVIDAINYRSGGFGYTLLTAAIAWGHSNIVKYFIDQGANVNAPTEEGYRPLEMALLRPDIVQYLIDHGADYDIPIRNTNQHILDNIKAEVLFTPPASLSGENDTRSFKQKEEARKYTKLLLKSYQIIYKKKYPVYGPPNRPASPPNEAQEQDTPGCKKNCGCTLQ